MDISLMKEFSDWLLARGRVKKTARTYVGYVRSAARLAGGEETLITVTEKDMAQIAFRMQSPLADWRSPMKLFFMFLIGKGLREDIPLNIPALKQIDAEAKALRRSRIGELPQAAAEFRQLRDRVILALLTETFLFPEELRVMALGCYNWELGWLSAGPRRHAHLNEDTKRLLEEYLMLPRGSGQRRVLTADSLLFTETADGGMLAEEHYWDIIRRALRAAEFERRRRTKG
ncbi:MAG: hypothetical protein LBL15_08255 [Oscillospiraceae bacterium]|nr:hypothetical protein [Oscillospiraceae bacterium]